MIFGCIYKGFSQRMGWAENWGQENERQLIVCNYLIIIKNMTMRKKRQVDLIFSNEEHQHTPSPARGNRIRPPSQTLKSVRSYQFRYDFKGYLMLLLAKVLPRGHTSLIFHPETGNIIGEQHLCQEIIGRASTQFQTKKFKTLPFLSDSQLNSIEYRLEEGANIYRQGVIEMAVKQLEKYKYFEDDCHHFRKDMRDKKLVLIRVDKVKESQAFILIKTIIRENRTATQENNDSIGQDSSEAQVKPEDNTSTEKQHQEMVQESELISIMQSSCNITENDPSLLDSKFCFYHQKILEQMDKEKQDE